MKNNNFKIGQKVHVNLHEGGVLLDCLIKAEKKTNNKKLYDLTITINKRLKKFVIIRNIESKYIIPLKTNV